MKKILSMLLVLCMVFALCACGNGEEANGGKRTPPDVTEKTELIDPTPAAEDEFTMEGYWVVTDVIVDDDSALAAEGNQGEESYADMKNDAADAQTESESESIADDLSKIANTATGESESEEGSDEEASEIEKASETLEDYMGGIDFDYMDVLKHMYLFLNADGTGRLSIAGLEDDTADAITWGDGVIRDASGAEIKYTLDGRTLVVSDEDAGLTIKFEHADAAPEALDIESMLAGFELPVEADPESVLDENGNEVTENDG